MNGRDTAAAEQNKAFAHVTTRRKRLPREHLLQLQTAAHYRIFVFYLNRQLTKDIRGRVYYAVNADEMSLYRISI
jgi:hypothetical protein